MNEGEINAAVAAIKREQAKDPDPRPTIVRRILAGTLRPDWTTDAEVFQWRQRENDRLKRLHELECQAASLVVVGQATG